MCPVNLCPAFREQVYLPMGLPHQQQVRPGLVWPGTPVHLPPGWLPEHPGLPAGEHLPLG